jgi:hypothetical protein
MNFNELNINYKLILCQISKNGLQTHPPRPLDYAIIKFTSSVPRINLSVNGMSAA